MSWIWPRRVISPWPPPYCKAMSPFLLMSFSKLSVISSLGKEETFGMPPAKETTSGLETTAKRARTSETESEPARLA